MMPYRWKWLLGLLLSALLTTACAQLIGIDDAYEDPTLTHTGDRPLESKSPSAKADAGSGENTSNQQNTASVRDAGSQQGTQVEAECLHFDNQKRLQHPQELLPLPEL